MEYKEQEINNQELIDNLIESSKIGDIEKVRQLLKSIRELIVNDTPIKKASLKWAAFYGHKELVKMLIDRYLDVWDFDSDALYLASQEGHVEIVKILLCWFPDIINIYCNNGRAICVASKNGHIEIVKLLIEAGADIDVTESTTSSTPLQIASFWGHHEIADILYEHQVFMEASEKGCDYIVKKKLNKGVYVNVSNCYALRIASEKGHTEVVKILLEAGAGNNFHRRGFLTYELDLASKKGNTELVKLLIKAGADVGLIGGESLIFASFNGYHEIVKILLDAGVDVHAFDKRAIVLASQQGHVEVVKILLKGGADVHACDNEALLLASGQGHNEIVKLLQEHINNKGVI